MATQLIQINSEKLQIMIDSFTQDPRFMMLPEKERDDFLDWISELKNSSHSKSTSTLVFARVNNEFLKHISNLHDDILGKNQCRQLKDYLSNSDGGFDLKILDEPITTNLRNLEAQLIGLSTMGNYVLATKLGEYSYPVNLKISYHKGDASENSRLSVESSSILYGNTKFIDFFSNTLSKVKLEDLNDQGFTLRKLIHAFNLNLKLRESIINESYKEALKTAYKLDDSAKVYDFSGILIYPINCWWSKEITLQNHTGKVIADNKLDLERTYGRGTTYSGEVVPLIRVFSLQYKKYFYADARSLSEPKWTESIIDELIVEDKTKGLLNKLFSVNPNDLMKDISSTQGQNLIIMASGDPGTGKSLTAEVYSNKIKKPIYPVEVSEIGYDPSEIEENLNKIFNRIQRWDCILLFDEADIFLQQRDQNLERAILVGIFLRVVEQFKGLMFLTSNRPEAIDQAFASRITLHIRYPKLDASARQKIWENLLTNYAHINLTDPKNLSLLAEFDLNGREIRNQCRLAKVLFNGHKVTCQEIYDAIKPTLVKH